MSSKPLTDMKKDDQDNELIKRLDRMVDRLHRLFEETSIVPDVSKLAAVQSKISKGYYLYSLKRPNKLYLRQIDWDLFTSELADAALGNAEGTFPTKVAQDIIFERDRHIDEQVEIFRKDKAAELEVCMRIIPMLL